MGLRMFTTDLHTDMIGAANQAHCEKVPAGRYNVRSAIIYNGSPKPKGVGRSHA